jgi:hypothetical protein
VSNGWDDEHVYRCDSLRERNGLQALRRRPPSCPVFSNRGLDREATVLPDDTLRFVERTNILTDAQRDTIADVVAAFADPR